MRGLSQHELFTFLLEFAALLATARALGALARRLKQPQVIGELLAGFLLGPVILGHLWPGLERLLFPDEPAQRQLLELLSWIGMIFLLLRTGLETDLELLRQLGRPAALASLFGILFPFAIGFALAKGMPQGLVPTEDRNTFALFLGIAMSISAVTVTAKILLDLKLTRRKVGMAILGASVADDVVGWVLLAVASSIATAGAVSLFAIGKALAATGLFLGLAFLLGRRVIPQVLGWVDRTRVLEHARLTSIIILAFALAAITEKLGLHAVLGAFVAGVIIRESPRIRQRTLDTLESLVMGIFAPIFFAYAGLRVTSAALPPLGVTLLVLAVAIAAKVVGAGLGARLGGLRSSESLAIGIGMATRGSMELIAARIGLELGVFSPAFYSLIVLIPVVTSLTTPLALRLAVRKILPDDAEAERLDQEDKEQRAVIKRSALKILVPTRCSPFSLQALHFAAPLAKTPGSTLVAMSVLSSGRDRRRLGRAREEAASADRIRRCFEEFSSQEPLPDFHSRVLIDEDARTSISEEAAQGYDFVFLGSRRPRTLSNALLVRLLEEGLNDIVVVRGTGPFRPVRRILVPTVGAFFSQAAAELAVLYARESGATVDVLHVIDTSNTPRAGQAELRGLGERMVEEMIARLPREGVKITSRVSSSRFPPRRILETADETGAHFILLGVTPKVLGERVFFGQTVDFILAHARCGVLLFIPRPSRRVSATAA